MLDSVAWVHSQPGSPLKPDEIHVWRCRLAVDESSRAFLYSYLSEDELGRAARFRLDRDRDRFITARGTLRALLARYLRKRPQDVQFSFGREGKPALAPEFEGRALGFNLSHSHDVAVFAFGWNRNIGVDVEKVRPDVEHEDIASQYFSAREVRAMAGLPKQQSADGFFRCWTRKEAYIKVRGGGLQIPLDGFDVSLEPDSPARFLGGVHPSWSISSFMAGDAYPAALVYDGPPADLRFFAVGPDAYCLLSASVAEDAMID